MKREIFFRGKDEFENWITGDLVQPINPENETIICEINGHGKLFIKVDPETVGQYTGIVDYKGNKIFEGDIIKFTRGVGSWSLPDHRIITDVCEVIWDEERCGFNIKYNSNVQKLSKFKYTRYVYEVIGNIHDNQELLN